ncbi:LysM domain/BON superfamily protein [uncultured Eubacterium sp.]|nr:LysM domain/BON superfamily protein [uncultured Eubacterium sp.]
MKTEQLLPKNIRQIGSPVGHTKVYIEDYVITFLNSLSMDKNTYVRGAILFGEKKTIEDDTIIYVKGAIEGQNLELDLDETVFNDEVWREIYQQKDRLFPGLEVIGWALLRMGFSVRLNDKIKKTHFENFPGEGKVLYMIDDLENEDAFYVYREQDLARQSGYYIYYDKNPMMQEYLAERREGMKESENYEKMMENMRDERLIRQFREKVSRKTKSSQRKGRFRTFSTAAAVAVMMIMGGTMYYYAQQDQSINFREVVNGAVNTMGKGVKEQVEDKSETTEKTKTVTKVLDTQASTVEKKSTTAVKNTTAAQITTAKKTAATAAKKTNASKYKYYKYTVKKGETLVSISRKVYGTQKLVKRIREANALSNQNQIYPGQKLIIPIAR